MCVQQVTLTMCVPVCIHCIHCGFQFMFLGNTARFASTYSYLPILLLTPKHFVPVSSGSIRPQRVLVQGQSSSKPQLAWHRFVCSLGHVVRDVVAVVDNSALVIPEILPGIGRIHSYHPRRTA